MTVGPGQHRSHVDSAIVISPHFSTKMPSFPVSFARRVLRDFCACGELQLLSVCPRCAQSDLLPVGTDREPVCGESMANRPSLNPIQDLLIARNGDRLHATLLPKGSAVAQERVEHVTARALGGRPHHGQDDDTLETPQRTGRCPPPIRSLMAARCSRARRRFASVGVRLSDGR